MSITSAFQDVINDAFSKTVRCKVIRERAQVWTVWAIKPSGYYLVGQAATWEDAMWYAHQVIQRHGRTS